MTAIYFVLKLLCEDESLPVWSTAKYSFFSRVSKKFYTEIWVCVLILMDLVSNSANMKLVEASLFFTRTLVTSVTTEEKQKIRLPLS